MHYESMNGVPLPLVADLGTPELLIILAVLILLFGAAKLPELARGSGRALRIFKAELQGLDDDAAAAKEAAGTESWPTADLVDRLAALDREQAAIDAERRRLSQA